MLISCIPIPLCPTGELAYLYGLVGCMASKKQIVSRLNHPCKSHEQCWIDAHNCRTNIKTRYAWKQCMLLLRTIEHSKFPLEQIDFFNLLSCCQRSFLEVFSCLSNPERKYNNTWHNLIIWEQNSMYHIYAN